MRTAPTTFRIGIAGHRWNRIDPAWAEDIGAALSAAFRRIAPPDRSVTLVCGMAEGADLLAAAARPGSWSLEPVLALPMPDWIAHLSLAPGTRPEDAAEFRRLVPLTAEVVVAPGLDGPDYPWVARHVGTTCDHLVAVWNGRNGLDGGTSHVVALARARGTPVAVLWQERWART